jgi:hypothetical protein
MVEAMHGGSLRGREGRNKDKNAVQSREATTSVGATSLRPPQGHPTGSPTQHLSPYGEHVLDETVTLQNSKF